MITPPGGQNSYKKFLTSGQLRNVQRYQKYVRLVRAFFLEFHTCSSQRWVVFLKYSIIILFFSILFYNFSSTKTTCTFDATAVGSCNLVQYTADLPPIYQNFDNVPGVDSNNVPQVRYYLKGMN